MSLSAIQVFRVAEYANPLHVDERSDPLGCLSRARVLPVTAPMNLRRRGLVLHFTGLPENDVAAG